MSAGFPLIYCNGDSYSDENYDPSLNNNTYAHYIGHYTNGFVINNAIRGSCNRRIIRTTLHDIISQRKANPTQKIIALIGLSFELRSEIWIDDATNSIPVESNFRPHSFSDKNTWREDLLNNVDLETKNGRGLNEKFYDFYSKGRAYFFSPYAERINLLADLTMLKATMESLNIDFLIFQSPKAEALSDDYLLDFFKDEIFNDKRFFDFENFGFCDWCCSKKFTPLDFFDQPLIAHYGPDAHEAFAKEILIPKLQELKIL